jgi:hypothetical protein
VSQETYNLASFIAQCASVFIAVAVGVVVYWYTKETQQLREAAAAQLDLMREQLALSVKPYVFATIRNFTPQRPDGTVADPRAAYSCRVWNATDRPANNVNILIYNRARGYFWTDHEGADLLSRMDPLGDGKDVIARGAMAKDVGLRSVIDEYGSEAQPYLNRLDREIGDYSALFFRDVNGHLYVAVRICGRAKTSPNGTAFQPVSKSHLGIALKVKRERSSIW